MRFVETVDKINGLPVGFKEVEYLESTGTQWIDTGINVDTSTDEVKLYFQLVDTALYKWLFGEYDANARVGLGSGDGPDKRNFLYQQSATKVSDTQMYNKQHLFEINSNGGFLDGTKIRDYINFASTSTIYLFNLNIDSPSDYRCKSKIWKYEHKRNGVLIRELIPCLDNNGIPCMYDLVGEKAYYNQSTGDFLYGREIHPVEYLESTGTQYIDLDYYLNDNSVVTIIGSSTDATQSNNTLLGCGTDAGSADRVQVHFGSSAGTLSMRMDGTLSANQSISTTEFVAVVNIATKKAYFNDTEILNGFSGSICKNVSLGLFNRKTSTGFETTYCAKAKVKRVLIEENGVTVREFIPAIDENNVPFMFDKVTHAVYLNAGTGEFLHGNPVVSNKGKIRFPVTQHEKSRLPLGFKEVEYLQSTGGSYIDTGIGVKSNTVAKAIFSIPSTATGRSYFGARNSSNERFQIVNSFGVGGGYFYNANIYPIANQKYEIEMHASGDIYLDGVKRNATNGTFSPVAFDRSLYIFSTNYYDDSGVPSASTFWKVQVFEGDTLVRDFIPCLDNEGIPCMYDLVEKKAYYNVGTGEFSYGREIHYVDYLESTGTQYIDTGIKGKNNIDFDYKVNFTNVTPSSGFGIGGEWESGKSLYLGLIRSNGNFAYHYANTNAPVVVLDSVSANTDYVIQGHMWSGEQYMVINGTKSTVGTISGTFDSTQNIALFRVTSSNPIYCYAKIYYLKIWDNDVLVRDYQPCIDENNVPFMFDKVTHTAYLNAGTGEFLYGNLLKQNKIRIVLPPTIPLTQAYYQQQIQK